MLCDSCGKEPAKIHYKEIKDNQVSEFHLCEKCAMEKGIYVCPECEDYPCVRIKKLAKSEPILLHDGERIREYGLDAWIIEQEERKRAGFCYADIRCYPCEEPWD